MRNQTKIFSFMTFHTLIGAKPLHIKIYKVDGFIRVYDGTRCVVLLDPEKYYAIYNKIKWYYKYYFS